MQLMPRYVDAVISYRCLYRALENKLSLSLSLSLSLVTRRHNGMLCAGTRHIRITQYHVGPIVTNLSFVRMR